MSMEFDLDAPGLSKQERNEFRYQTRSLTNLFERSFDSPLKLKKAWKVLIEVVPAIKHNRHRNLLGALTLEVEGQPGLLLADATDDEKCNLALKWLMMGTDKLADELGLDSAQFESAAQKVRSLSFVNIRTWKKSIDSPDRKKKAEIIVDHRVHEARLVCRIFENGVLYAEHLLSSELPDEFIYEPLLGEFRWIDNNTVELLSKDGVRSWKIQT
ncbi:MAG: hypothetical protein ACREPB_04845 [Arenimonas sp.]